MSNEDDLRAQIANLEIALAYRDVIGMAKGILMVQSDIGPDEAFRLLVAASQRENRKLHDVAATVVSRHEQGGADDTQA